MKTIRRALRGASPTAASIKAAVTAMPDGAAGRETRMTQGVREAILNADDVALQNSIKAALSEAMSPVNVLPSCPCPDESVKMIVRCATSVMVGSMQAQSLGGNVWQFDPPTSGTIITIASNVPPNVSAFDATTLGDTVRFNQVTV